MKLTYAAKRIMKMNFGKAFDNIKNVANISGKSSLYIFFDMIACGIKYGAGPQDYKLFEFYSKNGKQRSTYITRGVSNTLVKKYNQNDYKYIFSKKNEFNKFFKDYIHRDWLFNAEMTENEYENFVSDKTEFIYKPINGICGRGIEIIKVKDTNYNSVKAMPDGVIEQLIVQHAKLSDVYPLSINTVRVVTILDGNKAKPLFAFWRMGNKGNYVDNLNAGGISAKIDIETGIICSPAADKTGTQYTKHPDTGAKITGFAMPMWDKILETVCGAAQSMPNVGYVGWDVAISPDSVQLIEGNEFPGHDILQLPAYTPDGIGLMPEIEKYL